MPTTRRHLREPAPARGPRVNLLTVIGIALAIIGLIVVVVLNSSGGTVVALAPPAQPPLPSQAPLPERAQAATSAAPATADPTGARPADPDNALPNPSFELLAGGVPVGWEAYTWGGSAEFGVATEAKQGRCSASISSAAGADCAWLAHVPVKPRTTYLVRGWIRTRDLAGATGALFNVHGTPFRSQAVSGTHDWQPLAFQVESGDATTLQINCLFGGWGRSTGTAWFDDLRLIELYSAAGH